MKCKQCQNEGIERSYRGYTLCLCDRCLAIILELGAFVRLAQFYGSMEHWTIEEIVNREG